MVRRAILAACVAACASVPLAAQTPAPATPARPALAGRAADPVVGHWRGTLASASGVSPGGRSGTMTFTRTGTANFVVGKLDGDSFGKPCQETMTIGLDPETNLLAVVERRPDGVELVSVASWKSPIAITFPTSPLQAHGKTYQLRRLLSIHSVTSFDVTEEFSIDGGPFKRLGGGHYTKLAR